MASLDNLTRDGVVPDTIDRQPASSIEVHFPSNVKCEQGNELTPTQVKDLPIFKFQADPNEFYTLAKVDPDAPSRKDPKLREILHYLVANIPGGDVTRGDVLADYIGSGAPKDTGLHRYIFLVYHQKDGKYKSDMKISKTSRNGRVNFSIRKFAKDHNLGEPIAANFYQAQYDDYVPILHAQLSQG